MVVKFNTDTVERLDDFSTYSHTFYKITTHLDCCGRSEIIIEEEYEEYSNCYTYNLRQTPDGPVLFTWECYGSDALDFDNN